MVEAMIAHARAGLPNEVCGLLAGTAGRARRLYRTASAEPSPVRYVVEPREQLRILREIEGQGWELVGIYHSHTHSPAYPSRTDVELAYYPEAFYLIVSLMVDDAPEVRAFRILDGQVSEATLDVLPA
jgi:proteasome lid subunit RPN8/RPN11